MTHEEKWLLMIVWPDNPDRDYSSRKYTLSSVAETVREKTGLDLRPQTATSDFRRTLRAHATREWQFDERSVAVIVMDMDQLARHRVAREKEFNAAIQQAMHTMTGARSEDVR